MRFAGPSSAVKQLTICLKMHPHPSCHSSLADSSLGRWIRAIAPLSARRSLRGLLNNHRSVRQSIWGSITVHGDPTTRGYAPA